MNDDSTVVELTLDDISDLRAYERAREEFRRHVIALKKKRRVHVGPFQTLVFENRETIRFQIQEMARVEKIFTDEGIQTELGIYNPLISRPGKLSATLFIELTSDAELREWLPKLVGIERAYELHLGSGDDALVIPAQVDAGHEAQLTREEITASVHYVWFPVGAEHAALLREGAARVVCVHDAYRHGTDLGAETRASLAADLG